MKKEADFARTVLILMALAAFVMPASARALEAKAIESNSASALSNQEVDALKKNLNSQSALWTAYIQKDYAEQIAHTKSREAARLAFEKKMTAEWAAFYDSLKTMELKDREKALRDFQNKTRMERDQFNRAEGKKDAKFWTGLKYEEQISEDNIHEATRGTRGYDG